MVRAYYKRLIVASFKQALAAIGFSGKAEMMRGLLVWAVTVLVLFETPCGAVPVIGTDNPDVSSEVSLGLCALSAIIVTFALSFAWQLVVQPAKIDKDLTDRLAVTENALEVEVARESDRLLLSQLRLQGFSLYRREFDFLNEANTKRWMEEYEAWARSVRDHIKERWSVAAVHAFDDPAAYGNAYFRRLCTCHNTRRVR